MTSPGIGPSSNVFIHGAMDAKEMKLALTPARFPVEWRVGDKLFIIPKGKWDNLKPEVIKSF